MLNQFYVRKSHASLNFQQKMTWVFGFCSAICFISFGGHTLPQGHDLQRFFKGLVLILILEVWWPKCSQCVNINYDAEIDEVWFGVFFLVEWLVWVFFFALRGFAGMFTNLKNVMMNIVSDNSLN